MAHPDICPSGTKDKGPSDQLCNVEVGPYADSDILSIDHVLLDGDYAGNEIGSCDVNGIKYYSRLIQDYPLTSEEVKNVGKFLGARPGSGRFILDMDADRPGVGCIWMKDKPQMAEQILDLKKNTDKCEGLFTGNDAGKKCESLKKSMIAGYEDHFKAEAPTTWGGDALEKLKDVAIYVPVGFFGGLLAGYGFAISGHHVATVVAKKGVSKLGLPGRVAAVALIVGGALLGSEGEAQAAPVAVEVVGGFFGGLNEDIVTHDEEMKMIEESRRIQESGSNAEKLWFGTNNGDLPNDHDSEWQPQLCAALAADMKAHYGSAAEALRYVDDLEKDTFTIEYNNNENGQKYPHTLGNIKNGVREVLESLH